MNEIDLENWPRRKHFEVYSGFEFPHINLSVQVDITDLWSRRRDTLVSPTIQITYIISQAANQVPEFRQRIREDRVIEHDLVHPLITVMGENDLFGVTVIPFNPDFESFAVEAGQRIEGAEKRPSMEEFPHDKHIGNGRDDLLSLSVLPWLAFTGFSITRRPSQDTIPLILWGKVHKDEGRYMLPMSINVHHALVDGVHIARFVKYLEKEAVKLGERLG